MKLFCDGACRPNPGAMRVAVVVAGAVGIRDIPGAGDNNDAEWHAFLAAIGIARARAIDDAVVLGDSAMVVAQINGRAQVPPRFARFLSEFRALAAPLPRIRVRRIVRAQNLAGIALERSYLPGYQRGPWPG